MSAAPADGGGEVGVQGRCQAVVHVLGGRVVMGPKVHRLHAQLGCDQRLLQQDRQCRRCQVRSRRSKHCVGPDPAGREVVAVPLLSQRLDLTTGMPELARGLFGTSALVLLGASEL